MKISISNKSLLSQKIPALSLPLFEEDVAQKKLPSLLGKNLNGWIKKSLLSQKDFKGKKGDCHLAYPATKGLPERILICGLGKKKDFTWEIFRQVIGNVSRKLVSYDISYFALTLPGEENWSGFDLLTAVRETAQAYTLAGYQFLHYQSLKNSDKKKKVKPIRLIFSSKKSPTLLNKEIQKGMIIGESANLARDLVNHPSSYMTPTRLAQTASKAGNKRKLKSRILSIKEMKKLNMGGLIGVAKGSDQPSKFIILEYFPNSRREKPLVFVGKGITFDTGGISIKPASGMDQMKYDMAGGAAVIGALAAISRLGIKRNVVGLIPTSENMPGGHAYKPGDILKMMSGKTVEVLNTDAEGRLVLADALAYAQRYQPEAIVDLATLTGACLVALGTEAIGMMGNNSRVLKAVKEAGENTFERVWELPLWDEFSELIKSPIADIKNIGGRNAGTITAAAFLKEFVNDIPWVHLDIAGTAWTDKDKPTNPKGATGVGVRLLVDLAANWNK